jgi:hypothetical protein
MFLSIFLNSLKRNLFFVGIQYTACPISKARRKSKGCFHIVCSFDRTVEVACIKSCRCEPSPRRTSSGSEGKLSQRDGLCTLQRFLQRDSLPKEQVFYTPHLTHLCSYIALWMGRCENTWLALRATSLNGLQIGSSPLGVQ